ncbi:DoxX family protein [Deinococcus yunweiensis]|uniref:DoxX family protein n=1 Tax=Deinococcus yunweiensis TaxID=367282 RepID=UPI00398F1F62
MPPRTDLALALMRIATGGIFILHGWQKVFTTGLAGVTRQYEAVDIPLPLLVAPVTATLELLGGLLVLLGLGSRGIAGVLGTVTLLIGAARWSHGALPDTAVEVTVLLVTGCVAVAVGGAGQPAVDGRQIAAGPDRRGRRRS